VTPEYKKAQALSAAVTIFVKVFALLPLLKNEKNSLVLGKI
jgi:hypothetical protein